MSGLWDTRTFIGQGKELHSVFTENVLMPHGKAYKVFDGVNCLMCKLI